ncbi:MAG: Flp family type IVb pilin [Comamonas sp.]|nr:Flp family type IVb pilin [Comamonas sp.]
MKKALIRFWKDEEGATAIEYGLIAGLIAVVIIGTVTLLGKEIDGVFQSIIDGLHGNTGSGGGTSG